MTHHSPAWRLLAGAAFLSLLTPACGDDPPSTYEACDGFIEDIATYFSRCQAGTVDAYYEAFREVLTNDQGVYFCELVPCHDEFELALCTARQRGSQCSFDDEGDLELLPCAVEALQSPFLFCRR